MANIEFSGFIYDDAGSAVASATVELFDRNTTTPVRATTTTNSSGYWAVSHGTQGRFDVKARKDSWVRWLKYDDQLQTANIETANFRLRNPADTFEYDIVPAAITASRQLTLPLVTGTRTLAVIEQVALKWEGGNSTEGTTTSTSDTDIVTVSSLSIPAATPIWIYCLFRKTTGGTHLAYLGLTLNSTGIFATKEVTSALNQSESGSAIFYISGFVSAYARGAEFRIQNGHGTPSGTASFTSTTLAARPSDVLTSVKIRAKVANAAITMGVDEVYVYSLNTSGGL
jgi:hypothetical protein